MNPQELKFVKMHGLGNDFMVIDATNGQPPLNPGIIKRWGDRHFGVGFDQLLVVENYEDNEADFRYRIFNADGGEVEQCGNGARCFARFVVDQGLTTKQEIPVMTAGGLIVLRLQDDGMVAVDMGAPVLEPSHIPFQAEQSQATYMLSVGSQQVELSAISMGNPHAVIMVDDVDIAPVETLGATIECHPRFPQRVNVGFMQVVDEAHIRLRVFERGVGETIACGTGACAAVVAGRLRGLLREQVSVDLPGGRLTIQWQGEGESVIMTGPTETVYVGTLKL